MTSPTEWQTTDGIGPAMVRSRNPLRAMRRRWGWICWLSLAVGGVGTGLTIVQTPVYQATARLIIEPPRSIVEGVGDGAPAHQSAMSFFNSRLQMIASRKITERVFTMLKLSEWKELNGVEDPIAELLGWIVVKPVKDSTLVDISLRASDPVLAAKIVNSVGDEFIQQEKLALEKFDEQARLHISTESKALESQAAAAQTALKDFHEKNPKIMPGTGESIEHAKLTILEQQKLEAAGRIKDAERRITQFKELAAAGLTPPADTNLALVTQLRRDLQLLDDELSRLAEIIKPDWFDEDRKVKRVREKRRELQEQLAQIMDEENRGRLALLEQELKGAQADQRRLEVETSQQRKRVVDQQGEMGAFAALTAQRKQIDEQRDQMTRAKLRRDMALALTAPRIEWSDRAEPPKTPIRPIRYLQIPLVWVGGLLLGVLGALARDASDEAIREPEQLRASLDWPLLGVIPRLAARQLHEVDPGLPLGARPGTAGQEAFRSLRCSLQGLESQQPIQSLLVTSPQAADGKSFTAINLALACARAGESVLFVDVNLRGVGGRRRNRSQVPIAGLLDVLVGDVPWTDAVNQAPVGGLQWLPVGTATGVPPEILGTREFAKLIHEWTHRFDRVIFDGPRLLGLADARAVSRLVDGILLVVRAGAHDPRPLLRIQELAATEGLRPIGAVLNGARESFEDFMSRPEPSARRPISMRLAPGSTERAA